MVLAAARGLSRSTGTWPNSRKVQAVSRPRRPGALKYSALAKYSTWRPAVIGVNTSSAADRWLAARMAGPVRGTNSWPVTCGLK